MKRTPRDTGDMPGHGRVGHVDDPVPPSEYGDDEEKIQDIQRDALGDVEEACQPEPELAVWAGERMLAFELTFLGAVVERTSQTI